MRVLLVEDDSSYAQPLAEMLCESGYEVDLCKTTEALREYLLSPPTISLAILDLFLGYDRPLGEGLENIATVRRVFPMVPILVFTGHATESSIKQSQSAGASAILAKPTRVDRRYYTDFVQPKITKLRKAADAIDYRSELSRLRQLNENDLIHQILVPLLGQMGYQGLAASHHGPGEHGMDIRPFHEFDAMGDRIYYAAQVKAHNIVENARSPCNVASVLNQIEVALRTEVLVAENTLRTVDRMFLITSGEVTPDARETMKSWLRGRRQVTIIEGSRLIELLYHHGLLHLLNPPRQRCGVKILPILAEGSRAGVNWEEILRTLVFTRCNLTAEQAETIYDSLLQRERILATIVGSGVAMPHTYNSSLDHQIVVVCASASRYPWQSGKSPRVDLVVLSLFASEENPDTARIRQCASEAVGRLVGQDAFPSLTPQSRLEQLTSGLKNALDSRPFSSEILAGQAVLIRVPQAEMDE